MYIIILYNNSIFAFYVFFLKMNFIKYKIIIIITKQIYIINDKMAIFLKLNNKWSKLLNINKKP